MDFWQQLQQFEYFNEALIALGALLVLFGVLKILGSGLKLLFWVLLVALGGVTASYGWDRSAYGESGSLSDELRDLIGPGRQLSNSALRKLCDKLDPPSASQ